MSNLTLWQALALVLIVEGIMPFAFPATWRETMQRLQKLSDGQLRYIGLVVLSLGLILFTLL